MGNLIDKLKEIKNDILNRYDGMDYAEAEDKAATIDEAIMNNTRKVKCVYCGLISEMPVVETGCVSDGKPIKMYKVVCPRCGQGQWVHEDGEHSDK